MYSKQSTQAVKADAIPMAPEIIPNGSAIIERGDNTETNLEVDEGWRLMVVLLWRVWVGNPYLELSCSLITIDKLSFLRLQVK